MIAANDNANHSTYRRHDVATVEQAFSDAKKARQERIVRERGGDVQADYQIGKDTRFTRYRMGLYPMGASADKHFKRDADYFRAVEIAHDIDRNDIVVGQGIDRLCANILQHGFVYDPSTGSTELDAILKEKWKTWSTTTRECDSQDQFDFNFLSYFALRGSIVSGDHFALPLYYGALQLVEGYRCRSPQYLPGNGTTSKPDNILGVQLDGNRRRKAFHFAEDDITQIAHHYLGKTVEVAAYDELGHKQVIQVYHPKRTTQTRGMTKLAPCADAVGMHDDIQFAKLVQQQAVSSFFAFRKRPMGFEYPENAVEPLSYQQDPYGASGQTMPMRGMSPGLMYTGYNGEELMMHSPNVPNPTFFDHAMQIMQFIALNLDLPLIMFLLDASATNFSGWRGVMNQAQIKFVHFQNWFAKQWHRPILEWKIRQWADVDSPLRDDAIVRLSQVNGVNVFRHSWTLPTWPYIEPMKDVAADVLEHRNGVNSPRRIQQRRGRDWDEVSTEIVEDNASVIIKAKAKAAEINAAFPGDASPVRWRELVGLPLAEGVQMSLNLDTNNNDGGNSGDNAPTDS